MGDDYLSEHNRLNSKDADNKAKEDKKMRGITSINIFPTLTRVKLRPKSYLMKSGMRQQRFISKQGPALRKTFSGPIGNFGVQPLNNRLDWLTVSHRSSIL